jgi:Tfp pilus assembly major pilin PilA
MTSQIRHVITIPFTCNKRESSNANIVKNIDKATQIIDAREWDDVALRTVMRLVVNAVIAAVNAIMIKSVWEYTKRREVQKLKTYSPRSVNPTKEILAISSDRSVNLRWITNTDLRLFFENACVNSGHAVRPSVEQNWIGNLAMVRIAVNVATISGFVAQATAIVLPWTCNDWARGNEANANAGFNNGLSVERSARVFIPNHWIL